MKIVCSECSKDFNPYPKMLKERSIGEDCIEVYFKCPYCGTDFRVALHNNESKRLQRQIRKAEKTGDAERTARLKSRLKTEMDQINGRR